jgi:DTW domain-containing protein YfiP
VIHQNEFARDTNTGHWLEKSFINATTHLWQRTTPCPELVKLIETGDFDPYLLFPKSTGLNMETLQTRHKYSSKKPLFIVLDGTWQEVRKMLRQTAWLNNIPAITLTPSSNSIYHLRRNQAKGNLCTLEVGCQLLTELGYNEDAKQLLAFLNHYTLAFKADKSGHLLKINSQP